MTVLKGGTAAALYGSRAKDGAILITTKTKGTGQGIGVTYNSNFTTDHPLDYTDYQYEYGQGEYGVRPTAANPTSGVWSFGEKFAGQTQVLFGGITLPYQPVYDRINTFYRDGSTWTNSVALRQGVKKGGFNLSLSNLDNKGITRNNTFNRKTINLGFSYNLSPKLSVTGTLNYSNEYNKNPPQIAQQDNSTPTVIYTLANSLPLDVLEANQINPATGNEFVYLAVHEPDEPLFRAQQQVRKHPPGPPVRKHCRSLQLYRLAVFAGPGWAGLLVAGSGLQLPDGAGFAGRSPRRFCERNLCTGSPPIP